MNKEEVKKILDRKDHAYGYYERHQNDFWAELICQLFEPKPVFPECGGINCPQYDGRCIAYKEIPADCPLCPECVGMKWVTICEGAGHGVYKHNEPCPACQGTGKKQGEER